MFEFVKNFFIGLAVGVVTVGAIIGVAALTVGVGSLLTLFGGPVIAAGAACAIVAGFGVFAGAVGKIAEQQPDMVLPLGSPNDEDPEDLLSGSEDYDYDKDHVLSDDENDKAQKSSQPVNEPTTSDKNQITQGQLSTTTIQEKLGPFVDHSSDVSVKDKEKSEISMVTSTSNSDSPDTDDHFFESITKGIIIPKIEKQRDIPKEEEASCFSYFKRWFS